MVSISSSEDNWYYRRLAVRHNSSEAQIRRVLSNALAGVLASPTLQSNLVLGNFPGAQYYMAINILERPTRRTDKSFLFSALAARQEIRERFQGRLAIQYLVVKSSVLEDIATYAGIEAFSEAMQEVAFGIFAHEANSLIYYPLRPDATMWMSDSGRTTHEYSLPKYAANRLAELALLSIGNVEYA